MSEGLDASEFQIAKTARSRERGQDIEQEKLSQRAEALPELASNADVSRFMQCHPTLLCQHNNHIEVKRDHL